MLTGVPVAVINLGDEGECERVSFSEPVEISGVWVVGPVDGLRGSVGGEACLIEGDGPLLQECVDIDGAWEVAGRPPAGGVCSSCITGDGDGE